MKTQQTDKIRPRITVALSLDIDPDANKPVPGREDCVSAPFRGRVTVPAAREGLALTADILVSLNIPATLFWEARTLQILSQTDPDLIRSLRANKFFEHACHGLRHEDLSGELSQFPFSEAAVLSRIKKATDTVTGLFGSPPAGFRAPYCRPGKHTFKVLEEMSYVYDASLSIEPHKTLRETFGDIMRPAGQGKRLRELPLLKGRDRHNKPMGGYFWPMLEERRRPKDYTEMVADISEKHPGRLIQLALHPWHLAVREDGTPVRSKKKSSEDLRAVLCALSNRPGVEFTTLLDAAQQGHGIPL